MLWVVLSGRYWNCSRAESKRRPRKGEYLSRTVRYCCRAEWRRPCPVPWSESPPSVGPSCFGTRECLRLCRSWNQADLFISFFEINLFTILWVVLAKIYRFPKKKWDLSIQNTAFYWAFKMPELLTSQPVAAFCGCPCRCRRARGRTRSRASAGCARRPR